MAQFKPDLYSEIEFSSLGDTDRFLKRAKLAVITWYVDQQPMGIPFKAMDESDLYIVWFAKTLQNWKALVSTTAPDGIYFEITYNGDKKETYVDVYEKSHNAVIPDID